MSVVLNNDILKEICIEASQNHEIPWNFVLANIQTLKVFYNLLKTVKFIKFEYFKFEAVFSWGKYCFRLDDPKLLKFVCVKLLSNVSEINFISGLKAQHLELFQKNDFRNITKATIELIDDNGHTLYNVSKLPLRHLKINASCLLLYYPDDSAGNSMKYWLLNKLPLLQYLKEYPDVTYIERNMLHNQRNFGYHHLQKRRKIEKQTKFDYRNFRVCHVLENNQRELYEDERKILANDDSCSTSVISTEAYPEYESVEITVDIPPSFDYRNLHKLSNMLTNYCFKTKTLTLNFTGKYLWFQVFNIFALPNASQRTGQNSNFVFYGPPTLVEHETKQFRSILEQISRNYDQSINNEQECFSNSIEKLTLNLTDDIINPIPDALKLNILFENLQKRFLNLKKVDVCLDFTNQHESRRPAQNELTNDYTYNSIIKQIEKADIAYELTLEWIWSFQHKRHAPVSEKLTTTMGFIKIKTLGFMHCFECIKQISENKKLIIKTYLEE